MSDDPNPPFTVVEMEIAMLAGKGYGHFRIGAILRRSPRGVRHAIQAMALKLQNPDELPPLTLVQLWGAHRRWLNQHETPTPNRAA